MNSIRWRSWLGAFAAAAVVAGPVVLMAARDHDAPARRGRDRETDRYVERDGDARSPDDPEGIERQRVSFRQGDLGYIPMDGLVLAKRKIEDMQSRQGRDAGLWNWTWLGPGNIGGRIRTILPHPTISGRIFIGSVSGGIWRSDNSGASWTPVNDFMSSLAVCSLAIDPTNTNVLYAATGEGFYNFDALPGAGIFKSSDGGTTWNQLTSTAHPGLAYVPRIAHHPTSANTLYAACRDTLGVLRTTNGGTSWTVLLTTGRPPVDVKVQPTNANRILVGTTSFNNDGEVYLSLDAGSTWSLQTTNASGKLPSFTGRCEVAFGSGNTFYVSMDRNKGELWRTTDAGTTWTLRNSGTQYLNTQGWYGNDLWVDPTNNSFLVVGGIDLYRSTDGGSTLTRISDWKQYHTGLSAHADQHAIVAAPGYDGSSNRRVYFGNDGGIQTAANVSTVTQTSGWTNLANGLGITQFFSGASSPTASVIIGGTQDNDKLRLLSGGGSGSWYQAETGDGGYSAVNYNNANILYGCYPSLYILKSTNQGDSYFNAYTGLADSSNALSVAPFVMDPANPSILYAGGARLWKTTNAAASWFSIRNSVGGAFCSAMAIDPNDPNEIWAGYKDGRVSRSTNGGSTWTDIDGGAPGLPDRAVTDIAVSPYFANEAIVTFAGYNPDNVWITENAGSTWTQRTGNAPNDLPSLQVNSVTYHPSNIDWIYIGTDLGIFASNDFGLNWEVTPHYDGNDGPANVEVDDLFWHGEYLVAATHGRGMFQSRPLDVVYVDQANVGQEDGTLSHPYNTVSEGLAACGNGTTLSIKAATYTEGAKLFDRAGLVQATGGSAVVR